ncbi:MAG: hypothetical protein NT123_23840 [Proteobacteria bacterium]|nr:hypothetical protein [Pseudomonadota bacterium]
MKKAASAMYKLGDEMLFRLFDIFEMDHVCDLVRQTNDPAPISYRSGLSESLRDLLLAPIDCFIDRLHESGRGFNALEYPATDSFRTTVENLIQNLALSEGNSMDSHVASELADGLRLSWIEFIAYAAACSMYDELPKTLERKQRWQERIAAGAKAGGKATRKKYERPDLDDLIRACFARGDRPPVKAWAGEYGVSRQTIYNSIKRIKNQKG